MPTFLNPPLLWGLGLVALPVIIHLINLLRHRRVRWAAMEFLLAGKRKNSTWVRLKELLLLLLRAAAVAAVVLIVARPRLDGGLGKRLGDVTTHHIVLLDDSFSMSDRFAERNVFDQAKAAVVRIARQAAEESSAQTFTLLRTSRAGAAEGARPDVYAESVDAEFAFRDRDDRRLDRLLEPLSPSDFAAGPDAALRGLSALLKPADGEDRMVYVVSDFRAKDWRGDDELRGLLAALEKKTSQIYFVDCVDAERPNLAVASLEPESGTRAAGVHFFMRVEVRNYGRTAVDKTAIEIRTDGDSGGVIFLDPIEPGKTGVGRFPVFFSNPGEHLISVSLEADAVEADNRRYAVVPLAAELPVLIVDGAGDSPAARETANAVAPPGAVRSGLEPRLRPPSVLASDEAGALSGFRSIVLVNVGELPPAAVRNLEAYVRGGGGVAFLLGDGTKVAALDALHAEGRGLFPVPVDAERQLFRDRAAAGDIVPLESPLFDWFRKHGAQLLADVTVNKYFGVPESFTAEASARAQVLVHARLRNGAPYVVEKPFGEGRVVALLAGPTPPWSDFFRQGGGSYVIFSQLLQSRLSYRPAEKLDRRVGAPLVVLLDPKAYLPEAQVLPPSVAESAALKLQPLVAGGELRFEFADTATAGFYRLDLLRDDKTADLRHVAFNVEAAEGELARIAESELRERLPGVKFFYRTADRIQPAESDAESSVVSTAILYLLVALLLGEQALAYSASYHPPRTARAR